LKHVLIVTIGTLACAGGGLRSERAEPCTADTTVYSYGDTLAGVTAPTPAWMPRPRPGFGKVTVEAIVGKNGRVERGSQRSFGAAAADERWAANEAVFWTEFVPARRAGCSVRFRYRITFLAGIEQTVPDSGN
jgi:hypothetical protein